jgi:hypothetical protein
VSTPTKPETKTETPKTEELTDASLDQVSGGLAATTTKKRKVAGGDDDLEDLEVER